MLITDKQLRRLGEAASAAGRQAATAALAGLESRIAALEASSGQPAATAAPSNLESRVSRLEKIEAAARAAGAS